MEISHFLTSAKIRTLLVLGVFLASFSSFATSLTTTSAPEQHAEKADDHAHEKKGFDITSFIFHHIGDSHEFTFFGGDPAGKSKWVGIYLPVILYTENGLVAFSSSEFERNDDGTKIVEKKGQSFVKYHGKIYYAADQVNDHGSYVVYDEEHLTMYKSLLDFSITINVFCISVAFVVLILLLFAVARGYKKNAGIAPKAIQSFMEPIILFVREVIAIPFLGHR